MKKSDDTSALKPETPSGPRELYNITNLSPYNLEVLEKTLAGLPMKAASSDIDFCRFEKRSGSPYGHICYDIYNSMDTRIGSIIMEKYGENATTISFECQMRFKDTFEKILLVWDKHVTYDLEISKIIIEKYGAMQSTSMVKPEKPTKPEKGSHINVWFDWYHAMCDNGFKCTLAEMAKEVSHSDGYIRQLHARYAKERGLTVSNKRPNKN